MANEIRIEPPSLVLQRGQSVIVPVTIVIDRPLKWRGIHAMFRGAEESSADYTTTTTDGKGNTTTHTHTAVEHVNVVRDDRLLAGNPRLGFFAGMADAFKTILGAGQHQTLAPGSHDYEVEVSVPAEAPPTHLGMKTRVFYELDVVVDVPAASDLKSKSRFIVQPFERETTPNPVRTAYPDDEGRGLIDALFAPDIRIEMALTTNTFCEGEVAHGIVVFESQRAVPCRGMKVSLVGVEKSQAEGHSDGYTHQGTPTELPAPGDVLGAYKQEFQLVVALPSMKTSRPVPGRESSAKGVACEPPAPLTASGKNFSIEWFIQLELDVPWAKNPKVRAPIDVVPG